MRGRMGEPDTIRGVWLAALAIFGRYPLATLVPGAILGAIGEVPAYLIDGRPVLNQALTLVTAYVAYYPYLAYAEGIVRRAQRGIQRPGLQSVLDDLMEAAPFVPSVLVDILAMAYVFVAALVAIVSRGSYASGHK
jgi:hypothetical protein